MTSSGRTKDGNQKSEFGTPSNEYDNTPSLEDLPRYERPNLFNYDDETIAKKDKEVFELMQLYPNQDRAFIEQVWDMTFKMNDEEWTDFKEKCKEPAVKRQPVLKPIEIVWADDGRPFS